MTLSATRAALAAALSTVDGVTGYAKAPSTRRAGDGWPLLGPADREVARSFVVTWRVIVMTPQDEVAASTWLDDHAELIVDALDVVAYVDRYEPVELITDTGGQRAVQFTVRREN